MKKPFLLMILLSLVFILTGKSNDEEKHLVKPAAGFVPDQKTAITIAKAVLAPIYGEEQILKQEPFKASLKDGVWTVQGTLPKGMIGGTALAKISQEDARIILVIHGR